MPPEGPADRPFIGEDPPKAAWEPGARPLGRNLAPSLQRGESAPIWLLLGLAALGLAARLVTLGADALWADELYSWATTQMAWDRLLFVQFDIHPPLYYALLKAVSGLGHGEVAVRGLSAVCGLLTVAVVYAYARTYCGPRAALVAGAVALLSYRLIVHSSTARNYALLVLMCVAASWALGEIISRFRDRRPFGWVAVAYIGLSTAALMSHTVAAFYLAALSGLAFLALVAGEPRRLPQITGLLALLNAPGYTLLAVWFLGAAQVASDFSWLPPVGLVDALRIYVANITPANLPAPVVIVCALCVALGVAVTVLRTGPGYWVPVVAMTVALPVVLFALGPIKPVFMERTILLAAPGSALALAALVAGLRDRRVALGLAVLLVTAYAASALAYVRRDQTEVNHGMQPIQDFRGAVSFIDRNMTPESVVLSCDFFTEPALRFYGTRAAYPQVLFSPPARFQHPGGDWVEYFGEPAASRKPWRTDPKALEPYSRVLFLDVTMFCDERNPTAALAAQGFMPTGTKAVQGVTVRVYDRTPLARSAP